MLCERPNLYSFPLDIIHICLPPFLQGFGFVSAWLILLSTSIAFHSPTFSLFVSSVARFSGSNLSFSGPDFLPLLRFIKRGGQPRSARGVAGPSFGSSSSVSSIAANRFVSLVGHLAPAWHPEQDFQLSDSGTPSGTRALHANGGLINGGPGSIKSQGLPDPQHT